MKKFLITAGATVALAIPALAPAAAQASPIHECGSSYSAYNITTRNVSCHDARHFVSILEARGLPWRSGWVRLPGWPPYWATVRYGGAYNLTVDVRSTRTNHVIRFQYYGAD